MLVTVTTATLTSYKQHLEHPRFHYRGCFRLITTSTREGGPVVRAAACPSPGMRAGT